MGCQVCWSSRCILTLAVLAMTQLSVTVAQQRPSLSGGGPSGVATRSESLRYPSQGTQDLRTEWISTGSMTTARNYHTATLLGNGQVLVAGGCAVPHCQPTLAGAELYDPRAGRWTATGSMLTPRLGHIAVLLTSGPHSGDVLVAGGYDYEADSTTFLSSAELYNPASRRWTATGAMRSMRSNYAATRLRDGRILVEGGISTNHTAPTASAEMYDPATGRWTPAGSMSTPRQFQTATLLPTGQVLVTGGCSDYSCTSVLASADLYDPETNRWTATTSMGSPRTYHTATLLPNGTVLIAGGCADSHCQPSLASAEIYDPKTHTWTATGNMAMERSQFTATLLPNGQVLVTGGCPNAACASALTSAELYSGSGTTSHWDLTSPMVTGHAIQTATLLPDGRVLVAGGIKGAGEDGVIASAELYSTGSPSPTPRPSPPGAVYTIWAAAFIRPASIAFNGPHFIDSGRWHGDDRGFWNGKGHVPNARTANSRTDGKSSRIWMMAKIDIDNSTCGATYNGSGVGQTVFYYESGGTAQGYAANPAKAVIESDRADDGSCAHVKVTINSVGANPLIPGAPDINTYYYLDFYVTRGKLSELDVTDAHSAFPWHELDITGPGMKPIAFDYTPGPGANPNWLWQYAGDEIRHVIYFVQPFGTGHRHLIEPPGTVDVYY